MFFRKKDEKKFLRKIVNLDLLKEEKYEEFVEEIVLNMYKDDVGDLFDEEKYFELPLCVRDIMIIFDFETSIMMQGFPTYLGNSTGFFFEEVVEAFGRLGMEKDYELLKQMKMILDQNGISHHSMRYGNGDGIEEYDIVTESELYEENEGKVFNQVEMYEEQLSMHNESQLMLVSCIHFLEKNKERIIKEVEEFLEK